MKGRHTLPKIILTSLATGAVIGIALMFPGAGVLYREFKRSQWESKRKNGELRATIKRLEKLKLISWGEVNGQLRLTLTENGKKKLLQYKLDDMRLVKPKKWDGYFRVVIFDIPEEKRLAREVFRQKLKDLEFYQWQKSVFIIPFPCRDEIDFLRHTFEISPHVQYILAKTVPGLELKLKREFDLE